MKKVFLILASTLLIMNTVQAQTTSNDPITRKQKIQKGKVLRKSAPDKAGAYHSANGTRKSELQKVKTPGGFRSEPMVTKPLVPTNP